MIFIEIIIIVKGIQKNKDVTIHYDSTIQEIISDTSKSEKLNEVPTLKREASLQYFLRKLR